MKVEVQLIHLQAWAQEEIGAQGVLLDVLKCMEKAVRSGKPDELMSTGESLECALHGNRQREKKRASLMLGFAQHYAVPAATLSLSSVIERSKAAGYEVEALKGLRDRLRECVMEVARCSQLLSVMASHHHGVLADLLAIIGGSSNDEETRKQGVLLDAEA